MDCYSTNSAMSADQSGEMVDYGLGDPSGTEGGKAMCGDNGVQALFYAAYIVRDICTSSLFLELH